MRPTPLTILPTIFFLVSLVQGYEHNPHSHHAPSPSRFRNPTTQTHSINARRAFDDLDTSTYKREEAMLSVLSTRAILDELAKRKEETGVFLECGICKGRWKTKEDGRKWLCKGYMYKGVNGVICIDVNLLYQTSVEDWGSDSPWVVVVKRGRKYQHMRVYGSRSSMDHMVLGTREWILEYNWNVEAEGPGSRPDTPAYAMRWDRRCCAQWWIDEVERREGEEATGAAVGTDDTMSQVHRAPTISPSGDPDDRPPTSALPAVARPSRTAIPSSESSSTSAPTLSSPPALLLKSDRLATPSTDARVQVQVQGLQTPSSSSSGRFLKPTTNIASSGSGEQRRWRDAKTELLYDYQTDDGPSGGDEHRLGRDVERGTRHCVTPTLLFLAKSYIGSSDTVHRHRLLARLYIGRTIRRCQWAWSRRSRRIVSRRRGVGGRAGGGGEMEGIKRTANPTPTATTATTAPPNLAFALALADPVRPWNHPLRARVHHAGRLASRHDDHLALPTRLRRPTAPAEGDLVCVRRYPVGLGGGAGSPATTSAIPSTTTPPTNAGTSTTINAGAPTTRTVLLPKAYHIPLMFVAEFQWECCGSSRLSTSADPKSEWEDSGGGERYEYCASTGGCGCDGGGYLDCGRGVGGGYGGAGRLGAGGQGSGDDGLGPRLVRVYPPSTSFLPFPFYALMFSSYPPFTLELWGPVHATGIRFTGRFELIVDGMDVPMFATFGVCDCFALIHSSRRSSFGALSLTSFSGRTQFVLNIPSSKLLRLGYSGHKGFLLTNDEVDGGITAEQFLAGSTGACGCGGGWYIDYGRGWEGVGGDTEGGAGGWCRRHPFSNVRTRAVARWGRLETSLRCCAGTSGVMFVRFSDSPQIRDGGSVRKDQNRGRLGGNGDV
ncbi:hypothetical protein DFP72DRAFT_1117437 [Ephemerocybe angulata]|uniref:Uncharacterized protein n=1 Tax=Ephemerocybe angulata TaxID=980116 RepID=A0A8H6HZC7_9AGAR|nr:hypothetical protein DFP72DRAFT_1117437 [Tulosesus angulatus]